MTALVATILVFLSVAVVFLAANLLVGKLVRPDNPSPEKAEVYECGEAPVGSAWIQFDLRFYVVALLFVIFDVELAFFFPWATVFGTATRMADSTRPEADRLATLQQLEPSATQGIAPMAAHSFAEFAFLEMMLFFGILLLGFAYLWRRGDLEWVRSTAGQPGPTPSVPK
ncbi:MAG: NADH-quinone oxidoreductase subunit A [Gemmataceae bacterium]